MEIFSGPNPSVATLRAKVSETENSHWYNAGRHQGKFAGAGGVPPTPSGETRFCKPCNSKTHWESACWCSSWKCRKSVHRAEWCWNYPVSPPNLEQAKAAGEKLKKKRKGKKKAKKVHQVSLRFDNKWFSLAFGLNSSIVSNHLLIHIVRS